MLKQTGYKIVSTRIPALLAGAALCMALLQAQAQTSAPPPAQADSFPVLDVNSDGFIDKQEAAASATVAKAFESVDANKDGRLSMAEFAKIAPRPRQ